jgi:hypothetical protein
MEMDDVKEGRSHHRVVIVGGSPIFDCPGRLDGI